MIHRKFIGLDSGGEKKKRKEKKEKRDDNIFSILSNRSSLISNNLAHDVIAIMAFSIIIVIRKITKFQGLREDYDISLIAKISNSNHIVRRRRIKR